MVAGRTNDRCLDSFRAFNKIRCRGGFVKRDVRALIAAGIGLILWFITKEALWALLITIAIDSVATSLSVMKAYEDPKSETMSMWFISGTSGIFGALAVGAFNPILLIYPIYIILANYTVVTAMILGRRKLKKF